MLSNDATYPTGSHASTVAILNPFFASYKCQDFSNYMLKNPFKEVAVSLGTNTKTACNLVYLVLKIAHAANAIRKCCRQKPIDE